MSVTILSGPVGAGKSTVARHLLAALPAPVSYIEGDTFWSFIAKGGDHDRRELFRINMRAMTVAAVPYARSGFEVLLDFSIPPGFLEGAKKILKEIPLNYVVLCPSLAICETRAKERLEGAIADYEGYRDFYALFNGCPEHIISDDHADAPTLAGRIREGLAAGRFRVS